MPRLRAAGTESCVGMRHHGRAHLGRLAYAPSMDLFSRRIVGWLMQDHMPDRPRAFSPDDGRRSCRGLVSCGSRTRPSTRPTPGVPSTGHGIARTMSGPYDFRGLRLRGELLGTLKKELVYQRPSPTRSESPPGLATPLWAAPRPRDPRRLRQRRIRQRYETIRGDGIRSSRQQRCRRRTCRNIV